MRGGRQIERVVDDELGTLGGNAEAGQFDFDAGGHELPVAVEPVVVTRIQIRNEPCPAAKAAATNVQKIVGRLEALLLEELELQGRQLVPQPAHGDTVPGQVQLLVTEIHDRSRGRFARLGRVRLPFPAA